MGTLVNGIKEIFATSQTTATHLPVCASDGTPQGRISVGDLASVLGGAFNIKTSGNLNDMVTNGVCLLNGSKTDFSNIPTSFTNNVRAFLEVHKRSVSSTSNYTTQVLRSALYNDRARTFIRSGDGGIWEDWKEIAVDVPAFYKNYNDLASLQTALGVNTKLRNLGSISVAAGATETMDIGAYCGFVFIVNQSSGHISIIAASYGNSTEIVHITSAGGFSASCTNKELSITNNSSGRLDYSISLLV